MGIAVIDLKDVIKQSARKASLEDLARQGVRRVRILDEAMILRLIAEAVDRVVAERTGLLTQKERERIEREARAELRRRITESEGDRGHFQARIRELEEALERERRRAAQPWGEERERGRKEAIEELRQARESEWAREILERIEGFQREVEERTRQALSPEATALLQAKIQEVAVRQKADRQEVERMLAGMLERLTKKVDSIRLKVGGDEAAFRPGVVTIDAILREELETNLSQVGVSLEAAGPIQATLDRLRDIRRSAGAPA